MCVGGIEMRVDVTSLTCDQPAPIGPLPLSLPVGSHSTHSAWFFSFFLSFLL